MSILGRKMAIKCVLGLIFCRFLNGFSLLFLSLCSWIFEIEFNCTTFLRFLNVILPILMICWKWCHKLVQAIISSGWMYDSRITALQFLSVMSFQEYDIHYLWLQWYWQISQFSFVAFLLFLCYIIEIVATFAVKKHFCIILKYSELILVFWNFMYQED